MNRISKIFVLFTLLLLVAVPAAMAQDAEPTVPPNSISGLIASNKDFDTVEAALEAANLQSTFASGEWTLFAPTDKAFKKLGLDKDNIADKFSSAELENLIFYHTLSGTKSTADLKTMLGDITMYNGGLAGLKFYRSNIYVNDESKATSPNIPADNGYIHGVNNVVLPPWPRVAAEDAAAETVAETEGQVQEAPEGQVQGQVQAAPEGQVQSAEEPATVAVPANSIAGIADADGRFDTLVAAAKAAGLVDDLVAGEWTLFAPTDDAFAKLGLNADNIATEYSQEELANILLYHLMQGNNSIAQLKTKLGNVTMANGNLAGLKFYEDHIYVNDDSKVITENIITDNGTIHVVDTLVRPPWPRLAKDDLTGQVQGQVQTALEGQVQ